MAVLCALAGGSLAGAATSGSSSTSSTPASTHASAPAWLTAAKALNQQGLKGTYTQPPGNAPKPPKNKSVWIVPCAEYAEGCEKPAEAAAQAARLLGWKVTIVDGKFDPVTESADIEEAIAAKANAIITVAVDCPDVKEALINAKAAHIVTVSYLGADCNDPLIGGQSEYTGSINLGESFGKFYENYGKDQAAYIIASSNGKANIINLGTDDYADRYLNKGFLDEIDQCTTCTVTNVNFVTADLDGPLAQKAQTALVADPKATWMHAPYDTAVQVIANTIKGSGHGIKVTGAECLSANLAYIRERIQTACVNATDFGWVGYAAIDTVIRLMDGEKTVPPSGIGTQVVDINHNLPAAGKPYTSGINYVAAYKKSWGLK
jgi:ribose transport system substrate-binding protein